MFPVFSIHRFLVGMNPRAIPWCALSQKVVTGKYFRYILSSYMLPAAVMYEGIAGQARLNFSHKVGILLSREWQDVPYLRYNQV